MSHPDFSDDTIAPTATVQDWRARSRVLLGTASATFAMAALGAVSTNPAVEWCSVPTVAEGYSHAIPAGDDNGRLTTPVGEVLGFAAPRVPRAAATLQTVAIQAVRVADDDGGRRAEISPEQAAQWIARANAVFAVADLRFSFSAATDFVDLRSTLLNSVTGGGDANWLQAKLAGNELAARYPGKLLILFRYGAGANPTGGAFSSTDLDFVVATGFFATGLCGHQNITLLAHEIGHYFGLDHTFARVFDTVAEAETFLASRTPSAFDGDGLSDTPPDPMIVALDCGGPSTFVLNGTVFQLGRNNIMSYYDSDVKTLSPQQIERVRWILAERQKGDMALPKNRDVRNPLEAESLEIVARTGAAAAPQTMTGFGPGDWSGEAQLWMNASLHGGVTLAFNVSVAGTYRINMFATRAPDFGIFQFHIDNQPIGTAFDAYAPKVLPSGRISLGALNLAAGRHLLRLEAVARNPAASQYGFGLDALELVAVPPVTIQSTAALVASGGTVTFTAEAGNVAILSYQWRKDGADLAGATGSTLTLNNVQPRDAGSYSVLVSTASGGVVSNTVTLTVAVPPTLAAPLQNQSAGAGGNVLFTVTVGGTAPFSYQWKKDGNFIAGATASALMIANVQPADAGTYSVTISNGAGSVVSQATLAVLLTRVANLSVRSSSGEGADALIVGFTVAGSGARTVLIRAIGPTLAGFGVTNVLADPTLRLDFGRGGLIAQNNDWAGDSNLVGAAAYVGAFPLAPTSRDAALLTPLGAGPYTAQVGGGAGVALVEIYDASGAENARLANVSARARVGSGGDILIAGFALSGDRDKRILVRAVGPSLTTFGVTGALADPRLQFFSGPRLIAENGDWGGGAALASAFAQAGAFALAATSKDAALLLTLPAGSYTAQVSGDGGTTGVALVEVYEVP